MKSSYKISILGFYSTFFSGLLKGPLQSLKRLWLLVRNTSVDNSRRAYAIQPTRLDWPATPFYRTGVAAAVPSAPVKTAAGRKQYRLLFAPTAGGNRVWAHNDRRRTTEGLAGGRKCPGASIVPGQECAAYRVCGKPDRRYAHTNPRLLRSLLHRCRPNVSHVSCRTAEHDLKIKWIEKKNRQKIV